MRIFLFKFCYLQQGLLMEGAIFWGVGIEGFVGQCLFQWAPLSKEVLGAWREAAIHKAFPDVFHSLWRGVQHIVSIEAIVAKLVHHDFISWEIGHGARQRNSRNSGKNLLNGEEESGLRELALMIAIFTIADGANSKNDMNVWTELPENRYSLTQIVGTLVDSEFFFLEKNLWPFLAVVNNFASFFKTIDVVSTESQGSDTRTR
jgi:hypothetical protein